MKKEYTTGLVYDEMFLRHDTGAGHPERPERLSAIMEKLKKTKQVDDLFMIAPRKADLKWIEKVHSKEYIEHVENVCAAGELNLDSMDTGVCRESYEIALYAAGGICAGADAIMEKKVRNVFCAVRPPGHHAMPDQAMGFCLFGNAAITARYVQEKYSLKKVLIIDWDVHHGNGTQHMFYDDPTVFYFSIHQYPHYPGTGSAAEKGSGAGEGFTLNVPHSGNAYDEEYIDVFSRILRVRAEEFDPDFIIVSAGFDAHADDPLGGMEITNEGYGNLAYIVKEIADTCCDGRVLVLLEGGYDLSALADSVYEVISVMSRSN
ncbi:histone deacetylase [Spirochaetota bacterium]